MRDKDNDLVVAKANKLIQKYKYTLSKTEIRVLNAIISNINSPKYDAELNTMVFDINEFCQLLGYETGGETYKRLKSVLKSLSDKSSDYIDFGDYETIVRWIEKPKFEKNSGKVLLKLDDDLKPFLLQASGNMYAKLNYYFKMDSKYSMRLYELMKSWDGCGSCEYDIDELRACIDATQNSYENFALFRRVVLEPALEEINSITDIIVSYETKKRGRKVVKIKFFISKKNESIEHKEPKTSNKTKKTSTEEKATAEVMRPYIQVGASHMEDDAVCMLYSEISKRLGDTIESYTDNERDAIVGDILHDLSGRMIGKEVNNYWGYLNSIIVNHDWEQERKKLNAEVARQNTIYKNAAAERRDEEEFQKKLAEWKKTQVTGDGNPVNFLTMI